MTSANKTRTKGLLDRFVSEERFLAVEFFESRFNIGENRIMPPGVATLV